MRADQLHVVTVISNPMLWKSRIDLFLHFAQHMIESGVHLTVVECAYGDRSFELDQVGGFTHIPVRAKTLVWTKENLGNIGVSRLPQDARYVGFFDADIRFRRSKWAEETVHALQLHDVVQPWSDCYDLGPNDEHLEHHRSFGRIYRDKLPIMQGPNAGPSNYRFAHPGYAWAFRREALEAVGGFIETAALGAADHHMAMGLIGRMKDSIPGNLDPSYSAPLLRWQERATKHIGGNLGYVPGTIEHGWHGAKDKRKYVDRWQVLQKHGFNPDTDLVKNLHGVIELSGNKPALHRDIDLYFRQRSEDANCL